MKIDPLKIFIIYAREDEQFRKELKEQLVPLERSGQIDVWTDRELIAGDPWEPLIKKNLKTADVILILVSKDYFNSDYIHEVEIKEAIQRHQAGQAKIIPIIVRHCGWEDDPVLSQLQVLPMDGLPVVDKYWGDREAAYVNIIRGLRQTVLTLREERQQITLEEADWLNTKKIDTEEGYQFYLQKFQSTEGRIPLYVTEARTRIEALQRLAHAEKQRREAEVKQQKEEDNHWQSTLSTNTVAGFKAYLSQFESGRYLREARSHITRLQKAAEEAEQQNRLKQQRAEAEIKDWEKARGSVSSIEAYLSKYGFESRFAREAQSELKRLYELEAEKRRLEEEAQKRRKQEADDWAKTMHTNTIKTYQHFLTTWPKSEYANSAQSRIIELQQLEEARKKTEAELTTKRRREKEEAVRMRREKTARQLRAVTRIVSDRRFLLAFSGVAIVVLITLYFPKLQKEKTNRPEPASLTSGPTPISQEQSDWTQDSLAGNIPALKHFLARYPDSQRARQARTSLLGL